MKMDNKITYCLYENDEDMIKKLKTKQQELLDLPNKNEHKVVYVWRNIVLMSMVHLLALAGLILNILYGKALTLVGVWAFALIGSIGVQGGAHRLWSHRAYKANFGVRLFLVLCQSLALQNDIYEWCRDHRAHHKFSDSDGDPHNSSRGFFFSHVGWLLCKKHPEVKRRGRTIDMSDLESDPVVMFQRRFYLPLVLLFWGFIPAFIPVYLWGENVWYSLLSCVFLRYALSLNVTWLVNSWSHLYGYRPYNAKIAPVEATCRHLLMGEGFHNYHHAFPWDYSASELGAFDVFNPATACINFFHYMGWAWDLKKVNQSLIDAKKKTSGDHTLYYKMNSSLYEWSTGILLGHAPLWAMLAIHYWIH